MQSRIFATAAVCASLLSGSAALKADILATDHDTLGNHNTVVYKEITVLRGEHAAVAVHGDGSTILEVRVYDSNHNLIMGTTCQTSDCLLSWAPKSNDNFVVTIDNLGRESNSYKFTMRRY